MDAKQGADPDGETQWGTFVQALAARGSAAHRVAAAATPSEYTSGHPYSPDLLVCRPGLATPLLKAISRTTTP